MSAAALSLHSAPISSANIKPDDLSESHGRFDHYPMSPTGDQTDNCIVVTSEINASLPSPSFNETYTPRASSWDAKVVRRYRSLAAKDALDELTDLESEELKRLEDERSSHVSMTGEQILSSYRQYKVGAEMAQLLKRYVRIVPQEQNSANRKAPKV